LRKSAGALHGKKSDKKDSKAHEEKGQVGIFKKEGRRNRSALYHQTLFCFPALFSPLSCKATLFFYGLCAAGTCPE
jgi:hypothetical protein